MTIPVEQGGPNSLLARGEQWLARIEAHPRRWLSVLTVLMAVQISPWFYPTGDGSLYLSTVRGFLSATSSGRLTEFRCFVPPGYPLLILPAFLTGDKPFLALAVMNWLLAVALMLGTYRWMRRQFPSAALLLTSLVMVNITLWTFYRRPLKELAFMAILVWSVEILQGLLKPQPRRTAILFAGAGSLLITLLSLIRYPGLTVVIGFGAAMFLQAWRKELGWGRAFGLSVIVGTLPFIAVASWLVYDKYYVNGAIYLREIVSVYTDDYDHAAMGYQGLAATDSLAQFLKYLPYSDSHFVRSVLPRFLSGLQYRITDIGCMALPGLWKAIPTPGRWIDPWRIIYFAFFLLLLAGWWKLVRRRVDILLLTAPVYFLLYVHWVCDQPGGRFMLPILPAIVACAWIGCGLRPQYRTCLFGLMLFLHLGQSTAYWLLIDAPRAINMERQWSIADRFRESIQTEPGFVALQEIPPEVSLALCMTLDTQRWPRVLKEPVDPGVRWVVSPEGMNPPAGFTCCDATEGFVLMRRQTAAEAAAAAQPNTPSNSMVSKQSSSETTKH